MRCILTAAYLARMSPNVIRRLNRVCGFYGVKPVYIFCSATIANPGQLAEKLLGAPVSVIDQLGASTGEKHLLFWNPPMVNSELGLRASACSQNHADCPQRHQSRAQNHRVCE